MNVRSNQLRRKRKQKLYYQRTMEIMAQSRQFIELYDSKKLLILVSSFQGRCFYEIISSQEKDGYLFRKWQAEDQACRIYALQDSYIRNEYQAVVLALSEVECRIDSSSTQKPRISFFSQSLHVLTRNIMATSYFYFSNYSPIAFQLGLSWRQKKEFRFQTGFSTWSRLFYTHLDFHR